MAIYDAEHPDRFDIQIDIFPPKLLIFPPSPHSFMACARLRSIETKVAKAAFTQQGVSGNVEFSQVTFVIRKPCIKLTWVGTYFRVSHLLVYLWVDFDLCTLASCPAAKALLPNSHQPRHNLANGGTLEHSKSKLAQPKSTSRLEWFTLYTVGQKQNYLNNLFPQVKMLRCEMM